MPFYVQKLPSHFAVAEVIYRRCWYPKRCHYSGKFLLFRKAYCLSSYAYDLFDHELIYTWIERDTYITMKLKGEV